MLLNLFDGLPFPLLWLALAAIGIGWYLLICGGLYLLLIRSRFAESARRWKTQLQPTRPDQVRGEIVDGLVSISMVMACVADPLGSVSISDLGRRPDRHLRDDEFRLRNLPPCRIRSPVDAVTP
jgi:hypothetical protein